MAGAAALLLLTAGAAPADAQTVASPEAAVAALRQSWSAALSAHSIEQAVPLYTVDALFFSPEAGRVAGREAVAGLLVRVFAQWRVAFTLSSRKVTCSGSLCVDEGSYSELLTNKDDNTVHSAAGDYIHVLRRDPVDGAWRLADQVLTVVPQH